MKYGFVLPYGDARRAAELAHMAEDAGWDGFFVWEAVWGIDPWVSLAAAAMRTKTIRLGTMLTPLPIRKPWKLASETATLDNLSDGRVILSVGLGAAQDTGFDKFGEPLDRKTRAERLDEGLEILTGLWRGQPYSFEGKHYHVQPTEFQNPPPPVQPRIPIWVVGVLGRPKSMQRALRYDGLLPTVMSPQGSGAANPQPADLIAARAGILQERSGNSRYDIICEGATPADDPGAARALVQPWMDAGATWWIEALWEARDADAITQRVRQGPPR